MKRFLIVVDMQRDFIDGVLGTSEAQSIVPKVAQKIDDFDGEIVATLDTHDASYLHSAEGKALPLAHCIWCTEGWTLDYEIAKALDRKGDFRLLEKPTFGAAALPSLLKTAAGGDPLSVELCGLRTDVSVAVNALLLKTAFPETAIAVDAACCAGTSAAAHEAALTTMRMCQIQIKESEKECLSWQM